MEIYRTFNGPFPGCPSYDVLQELYRIALPKLTIANIAECSLEKLKERDSKMFFPQSAVKEILKEPRIRSVLDCKCDRCGKGRESNMTKFEDLVRWVTNHARLLLAILIYLGETRWIKEITENSIGDNDLHQVITFLSNGGRRRIGLSAGFNKSYEATLDLFRPPVFIMGSPKFNYNDNQRFPFLNDSDYKRGSFGQVRRFEIHPDYLDPSLETMALKYASPNAGSTGPSQCVFARKVLKYVLSDEEFETERQALRIIDEQKHDNIIDVIAFYSWRGELNCVFPFVKLNLHDVLHTSWKPEYMAEAGRFPNHWLWSQILGVADALKTIHNPPIQLRPDLGKIVGFHFDLKPSNILVTPDGVLKITDFGQSMVKMVQENEDVYGNFTGGDFAYGPPETCPSRIKVNELRSNMMGTTILVGYPHQRTDSIISNPTPPSTASTESRRKSNNTLDLDQRKNSFFSSLRSPNFLPRRDSEAYSVTAPSVAATSTASEELGLTATANYDVWSLACIMAEVLVFIFHEGAIGVKSFEMARKAVGRDLSFHSGNQNGQLKSCVRDKLDNLRDLDPPDTTISPGQPRSYLSEAVDVLYDMFRPDPKLRLSSDQVVERFESITERHKEDNEPNSSIIRYMKGLGTPEGFNELGYIRNNTIVSFYTMPDVQFGIDSQTIVDCRIQLFRKAGAIYFRVCYGDAPAFRSDRSHFYTNDRSFYCPLYLFDRKYRLTCCLRDAHVTSVLYFGTPNDLMTFQTAIMRHEPLRGVKVSEVTLHPYHRRPEEYTDLSDPNNPLPRCQFWRAKDPQYVSTRSPNTNRNSTSQSTHRARTVFFFGPQRVFGILLQDGQKMVKEERDTFHEATKRITIAGPDRWNRYFHFLKPDVDGPRSSSGNPSCPMIPLNSGWLSVDEKNEGKRAEKVEVKFLDHEDLVKFQGEVARANEANPYPINNITWQAAVNQQGNNNNLRVLNSRHTWGSVGSYDLRSG